MKGKQEMKTADFGTISHGTMRPEDLIPTFASVLDDLVENGEHTALVAEANSIEDFESEEADAILESLFDALQESAPAYAYFGAHPGDGSDYGFWLHEDFEYDFDGLKVNDTSEIPADYTGEVLHVNDHGNCTLYAVDVPGAAPREVWALV
jgi:hypothetical protein